MSLSREKKRLAGYLMINTVLLSVLYFVLQHAGFPAHYVYIGVGIVLGFAYVIYNRGFSGKNVTPDMLPDTMTAEEKQTFIEDSKERMKKSEWMLTLLLPILVAVLLDFMYLFFYPYLEALLT